MASSGMKRYLRWALATLAALSGLEPERSEQLVQEAHSDVSGEPWAIPFVLSVPCFFAKPRQLAFAAELGRYTPRRHH